MKFFAIRYFVVKSSLTLFPLDDGMRPKDFFTYPIITSKEVEYYNRTYTTRLLNSNPDDRFLIGYLLKSSDIHLIELDDELFNEEDIKNWEKLFFIIDTEKQIIAIEHQTQIATEDNVKNVLYQLTDDISSSNGYEVKLDYLVDKYAFWDLIRNSAGIYQIAFELNAPNLFGGSKKANEWLTDLKQKHNMTKVSVDFRNDNANLNYQADELESYRDYADSGGGNWTLGIMKDGQKKRFKSEEHLRKEDVELNADDPNYLRNNLEAVVDRLQRIIGKLDDTNEE